LLFAIPTSIPIGGNEGIRWLEGTVGRDVVS
jgi:hypothetical protein